MMTTYPRLKALKIEDALANIPLVEAAFARHRRGRLVEIARA